MIRGLVIGKFLPPHTGHDHLLRLARDQVDELVVVVCDRPGQEPEAELRAAWLADTHPDCDVRVIPDIGHDDDSEMWAHYTRRFLPGVPDVVFTSEAYGDDWARHLGCRHVCVDAERRSKPISGTKFRAEPARNWGYLAPAVRAGLTRRVVVVGAESTGTTTLANALADLYRTVWVPEYGREYSERKLPVGTEPWTTQDFTAIAHGQQQREEAIARLAGPLMFCDTDAMATAVWHERYMGRSSPAVEELAAQRTYAAYLLTGCEIPFVQDGMRDGEHLRGWMTERFRHRLAARAEPWIEVKGDLATRIVEATSFLAGVLGEQWIPEAQRSSSTGL